MIEVQIKYTCGLCGEEAAVTQNYSLYVGQLPPQPDIRRSYGGQPLCIGCDKAVQDACIALKFKGI